MPSDSRPNILLIHTDQQRADALGLANRRPVFSPHMDSIGNAGARFRAAYATCPVCIPQRLSLMTGQLATTHGVLWNVGIPYYPFKYTMPGLLRAAGYQTAHVGRTMHLRPEEEPFGFEYYRPGDPSASDKRADLFFRFINEHAPFRSGGYYGNGTGNNALFAAPFHLEDRFHHTHWTTTEAIDFLEQRDASRPFFLSVGYYSPHGPHNPPRHFFDLYHRRNDLGDPAIGDWTVPPVRNVAFSSSDYIDLQGELKRSCFAGYYGNVSFIDAQLGRLLASAGRNNTYVIFTSDHGEMLGDHNRVHKCVGYEGAARIPFLVMGPGIAPGTVCDEPVGWHDLLPTLCDIAECDVPDEVDGRSILSLLRGEPTNDWRQWLAGECTWGTGRPASDQIQDDNPFYDGGHHFITDGRRKLVWHPLNGHEQFFDLDNDPDECIDLSKDESRRGEIARWRARLIDELRERPEGFVANGQLVSGSRMSRLTPWAQELCDRRIAEGWDILYYRKPPPPKDARRHF